MSTPWSVEFNQYVLLSIQCNLSEILSNKNLNRIGIPILWDGIRLQMGLQVSCLPGSNKSSEVFLREFFVVWFKFDHVIPGRESEGGDFFLSDPKTQELSCARLHRWSR